MNTNSKLTEEQRQAGWIEIESLAQLQGLTPAFYGALNPEGEDFDFIKTKDGIRWCGDYGLLTNKEIFTSFIAYRPVPSYEECQQLKGIYDDYKEQTDSVIEALREQLAALQEQKPAEVTLRSAFLLVAIDRSIKAAPWATAEDLVPEAVKLADMMVRECGKNIDVKSIDAMIEARKGGGE